MATSIVKEKESRTKGISWINAKKQTRQVFGQLILTDRLTTYKSELVELCNTHRKLSSAQKGIFDPLHGLGDF